MPTLFTGATLIDCVHARPLERHAVLVDDGCIRQVVPDADAAGLSAAEVIDLEGRVLMPGLWDVHMHPDYPLLDMPVPEQVTLFGHQLQAALLESGIVGMRCAGTHSFMDVAWKRAFDSGQHIGPRLFAAGHPLTTTAGHGISTGLVLELDGPDAFIRAVREQIKAGVDHIKLIMSGGILGPSWDLHRHSFFLEHELRAAFDIARLRETKVMVHATNPDAVKAAIRMGAHSIEHGYILDDECIELLLKHDTWYVPTLAISHLTPKQAQGDWEQRRVRNRNMLQSLCCRADAASESHAAGFRKALAAGVKMALGSDIRPLREAALLEAGLWVRSGATAHQTLLSCTRHAAQLCGVGHEMGTIEPGKLADLIVLRANPLDDIHHLRQLEMVIKNGRIVTDRRPARERLASSLSHTGATRT